MAEYPNWAALAAAETAGVDYRIETRPNSSGIAHIAIHGGGIEQGTSELADAAATVTRGQYYGMLGLKSSGNSALHITSTHFDEPQCLAIQAASYYTVSYHGSAGDDLTTHLGGGDTVMRDRIGDALTAAGFACDIASTEIDGNDPANITQKNRRGMGVQLELSRGQRAAFFPGGDLSRAMRDSGQRTPRSGPTSRRSPPYSHQRTLTAKLRVYVRDSALARLGVIDDYTSLNVIARHNAVGAFVMEISADSDKTPLLVEGNGLIVRTAANETILSGPIRTVDWSRSESDPGTGS